MAVLEKVELLRRVRLQATGFSKDDLMPFLTSGLSLSANRYRWSRGSAFLHTRTEAPELAPALPAWHASYVSRLLVGGA
jgi:hypothetical protein